MNFNEFDKSEVTDWQADRVPARARSRHKSDKRDAALLLDLLRKNEFPTLWRRSAASQQVMDILHLHNRFVRQRAQTYNRLQALAHSCGYLKATSKISFSSHLESLRGE